MPYTSEAQRRFMALVHAVQQGKVDRSKVSKCVLEVADSMTAKQTEDFMKPTEAVRKTASAEAGHTTAVRRLLSLSVRKRSSDDDSYDPYDYPGYNGKTYPVQTVRVRGPVWNADRREEALAIRDGISALLPEGSSRDRVENWFNEKISEFDISPLLGWQPEQMRRHLRNRRVDEILREAEENDRYLRKARREFRTADHLAWDKRREDERQAARKEEYRLYTEAKHRENVNTALLAAEASSVPVGALLGIALAGRRRDKRLKYGLVGAASGLPLLAGLAIYRRRLQ